MTTLAELKTQAAALISDPDMATFSTTDLGYFINSAIAECSRFAPQRFVEDIQLLPSTTSYAVRGGNGNLVANPSFELGDDTIFDTPYSTVDGTDSELLGGWVPGSSMRVLFQRSTNAKSGRYVGVIIIQAAATTEFMYQDIPVNPGFSYHITGWHWKATAGGEAGSIACDTLDSSSVVVTSDAFRHDTTAAVPQYASGTIDVPDDGTVAYIRVKLYGFAAGTSGSEQRYAFEDISVAEDGQGNLVASNSLDQIEVTHVELWSTEDDDDKMAYSLTPLQMSYVGHSEGGWQYWDGRLLIPYRLVANLDTSLYFLRVRGYAPYDRLTAATQVTDLSFELEQAVMTYVQVQALQKLVFSRDLFTQWQTRAGNSDVSPAALMNSLSIARDEWRRQSRALTVLREGVS